MSAETNTKPVEPKELKNIVFEGQLFSARFSPCGRFLAAGSMNGGVQRWSVIDKQAEKTAELLPDLLDDVPKKAVAPAKTAKVESPVDLAPLPPIAGFNGWVQSIAFHPTDKALFAADSWGKLSCTAYEGETPKPRWEVPAAHDGWIRRVALSADGKLLATCGRDGFVRIWNAADGKPVAKYENGADVFAVCFTPDASQVIFGDMFGKLAALDFQAGKIAREFDGKALHSLQRLQDIGGLRALTFLKDGKKFVAAGILPKSGGTVQGSPMLLYFDFATGKLDQQFTHGDQKDGFIEDIAEHPAGYVIAVTSGVPGSGLMIFHRPGEKAPSFVSTKIANCFSVTLHPDAKRFTITATFRGSNGNGRQLTKEGEYPGNKSSVHVFEIPA